MGYEEGQREPDTNLSRLVVQRIFVQQSIAKHSTNYCNYIV